MTISDGSTILAADLDTHFDEHVSTLATQNKADVGLHQMNFDWELVTSATATEHLGHEFTVTDDDFELLNIGGVVTGSAGTYTVTLGSGPLIEAVSVTVTLAASPAQLSRYNDGTKPRQVLLRGATYTMTLAQSGLPAAGTNRVRAFLLLRTYRRRR